MQERAEGLVCLFPISLLLFSSLTHSLNRADGPATSPRAPTSIRDEPHVHVCASVPRAERVGTDDGVIELSGAAREWRDSGRGVPPVFVVIPGPSFFLSRMHFSFPPSPFLPHPV